jgi:hypothetical protein
MLVFLFFQNRPGAAVVPALLKGQSAGAGVGLFRGAGAAAVATAGSRGAACHVQMQIFHWHTLLN